MQPSFPLKVFRREKIPQKKRLHEQFRSSTIPDNEDWKEAAGRVLPSSLTDWRAANMLRGDHSYLQKFIYSNFINEAKETFAQLPLPVKDFELSGVCESILDWLNELSFLQNWDPPTTEDKNDVWLHWSDDAFRTINEGENTWVRRDPGSHPCKLGDTTRVIRNEFVLNANHECNFTISAGPRFGPKRKQASFRVTDHEGRAKHGRDAWGVLGPRLQICEAPAETIQQLGHFFLKGFNDHPGWFTWWDQLEDRARESYLKRPKYFGLPPDLDEGVASALDWEWRQAPPGTRFESESFSHPAAIKSPVNFLYGKGNQLQWSDFENSRRISDDGRKRAIRYVLEPIPIRPKLTKLFGFLRWEQGQLAAVQKAMAKRDDVTTVAVPHSLTREQRRQYRGPLRDHQNQVHAKFVNMDFDLRSRSQLRRDFLEKGDMTFRRLEEREAMQSETPQQPSRTQSSRPVGRDDWGTAWVDRVTEDDLERERAETRRQASIHRPELQTPSDQRWPVPETTERLPNPSLTPTPRSRPSPSPMPSARTKRDMTPSMAPVKELEEQPSMPTQPSQPSVASPPKEDIIPKDIRMLPAEEVFGKDEAARRDQAQKGDLPHSERKAPRRRKDELAEEQMEADDAVNNARRVEEGLTSLDPKDAPTPLPPKPTRPAPERWSTQADLDAMFAGIVVNPVPESDPQQADFTILHRSDLENDLRMKSFGQPFSGSQFGIPAEEVRFLDVRGEHFASAETAWLRAQTYFGGLTASTTTFRFHQWNASLRRKLIRTLRLAILAYTLESGRSSMRKRSMLEYMDMRPQGASRAAVVSTPQPPQPSAVTEPPPADPLPSRRAPSPHTARTSDEPRGRTLVRRGMVPRSRSVAPVDQKPDTGIVATQAHLGFASAAMGSFGRENGFKLGWLDGLPLSQTQRIQAACVTAPAHRTIQFFLCFGCARYCAYCDNKPGCHCHPKCQYPRCEGKQPSNELIWWESRKAFRWPWRMSNSYSARELHVDDSCTTLKAGVEWVGSTGKSPDERNSLFVTADFIREQCSMAWSRRGPFPFVIHVSNASGSKRNVPCLQTDGRVAPGTTEHQTAFCERQNDLRVKWRAARREPQRLWDSAWNVEGGESPHSYGPDHPALLCTLENCTAAEWCSYLWCTGWYQKNGEWKVCWSACRHMADEVVAY